MTAISLKKRTPEEREAWMNQQIIEHVAFKQQVKQLLKTMGERKEFIGPLEGIGWQQAINTIENELKL